MDAREVISSQYLAALEMLKRAVVACPEALWDRADDSIPFWQVAYHALFFTHLYLQESTETFTYWPGHHEEYRFEHAGGTAPPEPPAKSVLLNYLAFCQRQVHEYVPTLVFEAASGFDWLPFTKFELQLYSIRHIQQHVGELMERLGPHASAIDWVGTYPDGAAVG
jgi:hypothetical protein